MSTFDISRAKDNGVLKEIIKEGQGEELPSPSCKVTVHYTGTLLDGTKFDSSRDRNEPFSFTLGVSEVIKGWDIGVATMKKGEIAILTCKSKYAYGKNGSPPKIPPDATLKFEVELIDWESEDISPNSDKSILRNHIVAGTGYSSPEIGSLVNVHLIGEYDGKIFEDREVQFSLGEGENVGIIEGVEKALERFKTGEKSKLYIHSKFAFQKHGKPEFNIPPNANVIYIVELKSFEKALTAWSLKPEEKIEQAKLLKEKGGNYFKEKKYNLAIKMYDRVLSFLKIEENVSNEIKNEENNLRLLTNLNLALCYLKTNQNNEAKDTCNKVLEVNDKNEKALFRRGQAYLNLAAPEIAIKDFEEVIKIEPKNTAAAKQIIVCKAQIKKHLEKEKKLFANMFEKFAQEDKQEII
ncbi:FK506-binding protein 59 isoform X2 [Prorops nasuta]|uniref:FK506-binding protein 59 isoform X2 n=1 Tax=Prorops nasuta TaxID=863751 RepID=UPI0034CE4D8D